MTTYHYTARDRTGVKAQGSVEASTRHDALRLLERRGLVPVSLHDASSAPPHVGASSRRFPVVLALALVVAVVVMCGLVAVFGSTEAARLRKAKRLADANRFEPCTEYIHSQSTHFQQLPAVSNLLMQCWLGKAKQLHAAGRYKQCADYILSRPAPLREHPAVSNLLVTCWMGTARSMFSAGHYSACIQYIAALPDYVIETEPAKRLFLSCRASMALQAYSERDYRRCIELVDEVDQFISPLDDRLVQAREESRVALLGSRFPNVTTVLDVLFEGQGLLDTGRYSRDQQEQIFAEKYKGQQYFVQGKVSDVGETTFGNRKYISVMVTTGHYFAVYPTRDFNLLDYSKGQSVGFVGRWTELGTGIMFKHKIEDAVVPSESSVASSPSRASKAVSRPADQQAFAERLRQYQNQLREVKRLNNDLRVQEVSDEAKAFLEENRQIQNWVGAVQGVADSLGSSWVKVTADGVEYNLWPPEKGFFAGNDPLPIFRDLSKGQQIRFSGQMTGSMRLTSGGAINDPCMKVNPTSIEVIE